MTALAWLLVGSVVICAGALAMTLANLRFYRPAQELAGDERRGSIGPLVSACVPARNEEANIETCVRSLLAQSRVNLEVLVYNDQSTDRTGEILARLGAEDPRVKAVQTAELPAGWNGKQWGCDRMGRAAAGEWLLFTDADVRFEPGCLEAALGEAGRLKADLVSTFPRQVTGTLAEALVVPLIHFILLSYLPFGRMRGTSDPAASAGCGQFLLVRREAWAKAGGHEAFKDSMHDGIKLPRALRRAGFRTDLFDGTSLCRVRMYRGLGQVWRGFAKNAYEGLGSIWLLMFITVLHAIGHGAPWAVIVGAMGLAPVSGVELGLALAAAGIALAQRLLLARRFEQSMVGAVLHPFGLLMLTAIQWHSFLLHVSGKRTWRGRTAGA